MLDGDAASFSEDPTHGLMRFVTLAVTQSAYEFF